AGLEVGDIRASSELYILMSCYIKPLSDILSFINQLLPIAKRYTDTTHYNVYLAQQYAINHLIEGGSSDSLIEVVDKLTSENILYHGLGRIHLCMTLFCLQEYQKTLQILQKATKDEKLAPGQYTIMHCKLLRA